MRRIRLIGGWLSFVLALAAFMVPLSLLFLGVDGVWVMTLVLMGAALPLLLMTGRALWKTAQLHNWHAATDLPPFALRMSPAALELGCEGATAPVVLPWAAFPGFKLRRRYGRLVLVLARRIRTNTPGVTGLDQPAAAATLGHDWLVKSAGFYSINVLNQPLSAIDDALRYFTGGRAGIRGQQLRARNR